MSDNQQVFDPEFIVDKAKCIGCGACAADCPARVIKMNDRQPAIPADKRENCIGCQHCLAICPTGAISVLGNHPDASWLLNAGSYDVKGLETLIRGRRSVRQFTDAPVAPETLERLIAGMAYAPTGVNDRRRLFSIIDNRAALAAFRDKALRKLAQAAAANRIPEPMLWMADMAAAWFDKGKDNIFRNAPHLLVVSAPKDAHCNIFDCMIALSYFDLLAQGMGIGTVWAGLIYMLLAGIAPELQADLGIGEDYQLGYCMLFGNPAVRYPRTVQREPENVRRISTFS